MNSLKLPEKIYQKFIHNTQKKKGVLLSFSYINKARSFLYLGLIRDSKFMFSNDLESAKWKVQKVNPNRQSQNKLRGIS